MNKFIMPAAVLSCAMMCSCTSVNESGSGNTTNFAIKAINLVTDLSTGTTTAGDCTYSFYLNLYTAGSEMTASSISVGGQPYTFRCDPTTAYTNLDGYLSLTSLSGNVGGNSAYPVLNSYCALPLCWASAEYNSEDVVNLALVKFDIGDNYKLCTVQPEAIYRGVNITRFPGSDGSPNEYESKSVAFRVSVNASKKTANVYIFNAKFAEGMPMLHILLEDLPVTFNRDSYSIKASDVEPKVLEGNGFVPNPSYKFNSFDFRMTGNDNISAMIDYQVATRFTGSFTGSYVKNGKSSGSVMPQL